MSKYEADREDLLKEATALVERAELEVPGLCPSVVVGFRRDGAASVYLGADPVYQFNAQNQLRRGHHNGRIIKAERGRLALLTRRRSQQQVQLLRHDLDDEEAEEFLTCMRQQLRQLETALRMRRYRLVGEVPLGAEVSQRIQRWLEDLPDRICLAQLPHAGQE